MFSRSLPPHVRASHLRTQMWSCAGVDRRKRRSGRRVPGETIVGTTVTAVSVGRVARWAPAEQTAVPPEATAAVTSAKAKRLEQPRAIGVVTVWGHPRYGVREERHAVLDADEQPRPTIDHGLFVSRCLVR